MNFQKRKVIDEIRDIFANENEFLILTHKNADVDAVGSALALYYYLYEKNKRARIGCESLNKQAKIFLRNINESIDNILPAKPFGTVVLVDSSSVKKLGIFEECVGKAENVIVIDHHEESGMMEEFLYYNETVPSNAEIIYNLFPMNDEKYLKAILAGIVADTGYFKYAMPETFGIVHDILMKGIDLQEIFILLKNDLDRSRKIAVLKACKRMKIYTIRDLIVATTRVGAHEALAAKSLLSIGADISFVASRERISSRTTDAVIQRGINLAEVMHKVGRLENGDGGGHKAAAGAESLENPEKALKTCVKIIGEQLDAHERKS